MWAVGAGAASGTRTEVPRPLDLFFGYVLLKPVYHHCSAGGHRPPIHHPPLPLRLRLPKRSSDINYNTTYNLLS